MLSSGSVSKYDLDSVEGTWVKVAGLQLEPSLFASEEKLDWNSGLVGGFQVIMEQWLTEPQQLTKTILRADLLSDVKLESELGINPSTEPSQQDAIGHIQRIVTRQLLPRRPRDSAIFQKLVFYTKAAGFHVCHIPYVKPNETPSISPGDGSGLIPVASLKEPFLFPSFHPRVKAYQLSCFPRTNEIAVSVQFLPCDQDIDPDIDPDIDLFKTTKYILSKVLATLGKFMLGVANGYQKRVNHDLLVDKAVYQDRYLQVKSQFQHWVADWPEATDPSKFVFEELGIATFLDVLWEKPASFIDLGCGNGFLTHVLCELGHKGYGVDQVSRKIWSKYPNSTMLVAETVIPSSFRCDKEWLVGNHSDELTPWIPVIAALSGYDKKVMILPCCFYDFSGNKYIGTMDGQLGRYENYLLYIKFIMDQCGFQVETEALRIPSTKNVALVGRRRTYPRDDLVAAAHTKDQIMSLIDQVLFHPRVPDHLKGSHVTMN